MSDFAALREQMVRRQIGARGITSPAILDAFRAVPREAFVAEDLAAFAYDDGPLPIGRGQTISQPYIVALMIDAAEIRPGARVLEVGAGSGYAAAVISRIAATVVAIERQPELVRIARERMALLGFDNVEIVAGDGTLGWPDGEPYDAILAAASGSHVPKALLEQLVPGGRIVMPIGDPGGIQRLVKAIRRENGSLTQETLCEVRFVPLIGAEGWRER
ncbi:MAG TPA: protein-L-isoaspartate(D-aspartate) O-methyltransferase [Sphingomicrobium sp.]|nr:protein-L-isoaspartate(D-aspartate) O-methyltransferase [Sphingomicrobium sp.]